MQYKARFSNWRLPCFSAYSFENGYHEVHYCELDEHGTATDNTLLFSNEKMELSKSGSVAAHFLFMSLENTYTEYLTAFGKFVFEIETENYHLEIRAVPFHN